jgi:hypothetical protein
MNANELADEFKNRDWDEVDAVLWCEKAATMLRQQANRLDVLEANYKLQKDINEKALDYIAELEKGLQASLNLNRAQNERK